VRRRLLAMGGVGLCVVAAACSQSGGNAADGGDAALTGAGEGAGADMTVAPDALATTPDAAGDSPSTPDTAAMEATSGSSDVVSPDATADAGEAGDALPDSTVASEGGADSSGDADAMPPTDAANDADAYVNTVDGGNPEIDYSTPPVTLTMTFSPLAPGAEAFECATFANPWGRQVDVKTYGLQASFGFYSFYAFYQSNAVNADAAACPQGGLTFGPFTFFAETPQATITYPSTVGATIPSNDGFLLSAHYVNTTSQPLQATVSLTMYVAKNGVVTNHAGVLFLNQSTITLPATGCTTASGGCQSTGSYTLPQATNVVLSDSLMTHFATHFIATTSTGATLYQTTQWSAPPPQIWSPPLSLSAGTTVTWSCSYVNNTGSALTFGGSAISNATCISTNVIYPIADVTNPVLGTGL